MQKLIWLAVLTTTIFLSANCKNKPLKPTTSINTNDSLNTVLLKAKAVQAKVFCEQKKMNSTFCLLANMKVHSGKARFYIWDFKQDKAIDSGLVSHGCGSAPWGVATTKEKQFLAMWMAVIVLPWENIKLGNVAIATGAYTSNTYCMDLKKAIRMH